MPERPETERPAIDAIILAAGRSRRMGSPKAMLDLAGETALTRMCRVLRSGGVESVLVVLPPTLAEPADADPTFDAKVLVNPHPERGLSESLRIGLASLAPNRKAFFVCPVDVPLFTASDVKALVGALADAPDEIAIVAPSDGAYRGHPVLFRRTVADEFLALSENEPPHVVIRRDPRRVNHVVLANEWLFRDLDTPADHRAAQAALARDPRLR